MCIEAPAAPSNPGGRGPSASLHHLLPHSTPVTERSRRSFRTAATAAELRQAFMDTPGRSPPRPACQESGHNWSAALAFPRGARRATCNCSFGTGRRLQSADHPLTSSAGCTDGEDQLSNDGALRICIEAERSLTRQAWAAKRTNTAEECPWSSRTNRWSSRTNCRMLLKPSLR